MVRGPTPQVSEPASVGHLLEEAARPVSRIAIGARSHQCQLAAVAGHPCCVTAEFAGVILRRELAATAPTLVADAPETHVQRLAFAVRGALVGQRRRTRRRIAVFHPTPEFLRR